MKILLHICCAPCLIYPLEILKKEAHEITGYFTNNNIHPFTEFKKRIDALKEYAGSVALNVIFDESYDINDFLRRAVFNEDDRCSICYIMRLEKSVEKAAADGYDAFTTTLLYSKYQKHEAIIRVAQELSNKYGVKFYYQDFREGWGRGIKLSKSVGMYRQQYCGCIYSERERYFYYKGE